MNILKKIKYFTTRSRSSQFNHLNNQFIFYLYELLINEFHEKEIIRFYDEMNNIFFIIV